MYEDAQYAGSRLNGTIVRSKSGAPIVIDKVVDGEDGGLIAYTHKFTEVPGVNRKKVLLNNLDLSPVPLGFAYNGHGVAYLQRTPKRNDWRQGLRRNTLRSSYGVDKRLITDTDLKRTIEGKYLNFELALDEADNLGIDIPWCREFCIGINRKLRHPTLLYKWFGEVGDFIGGIPQLKPEFEHLHELLQERM